MAYLLIAKSDGSEPQKYEMNGDAVLVGRQPYCDVVVNDSAISREHAKFEKVDGAWRLEDLQSRNGVRLNGKRIGYDPVLLTNGDRILLGDVPVTFVDLHEEEGGERDARRNHRKPPKFSWGDDDFDPTLIKSQYLMKPSSVPSSEDVRRRSFSKRSDYEAEIKLLEDRVRVLLNFARILGKAEDARDLKPKFLQLLLSLFPQADAACVLAPDEEKHSTDGKPIWTLGSYANRNGRADEKFVASRAIVRHVVSTRAAVLSDYAPNDARFDGSESLVGAKIASVMAAPIYDPTTDSLFGVIQIDSRESKKRFTRDDLRLLVSLANQIAVYWENQRYRDAFLQKKLALQEMQVANQVQRGFLPLKPPTIQGYEFFDYYRPAKFVGGDYFDYAPLPDGKVVVVLGDVSGKGITASLLMAKLSSEMRYGLLLEKSYGAAMERLNRIFLENHWGDRFVTLIMVVLDSETGVLKIYNAGHLFPILSKTDGSVEAIGEGFNSFPLGIVADAEYPEFAYKLEKGESIALMSDGFPDAMSVQDEPFGNARVQAALRNPDGLGAAALGKQLVDSIKSFADKSNQTDDQCLVVFRRTEEVEK